MQSFLAKHEDCREQVIQDGKFVIIIRELGCEAEANNEYKDVKNEARRVAKKIEHLKVKEKTITKQIRHKPLRRILSKRRILGLPVRWDEEDNSD